jgi:outer dense fiber protein 2
MKPRDFVNASVNQSPWVPPPGKSTRGGMVWKSGSHRLEITPADEEPGDTVLRLSDLASEGTESTEAIVENGVPGSKKLQRKVDSLRNDVQNLRAEVDLDRSLREYKEKLEERNESRRSLREKELEVMDLHDELQASNIDRLKLKKAVSELEDNVDNTRFTSHRHTEEPLHSGHLGTRKQYSSSLEKQREALVKKLAEAEMDSTAMSQQVHSLKTSLKKLKREKHDTSVQVAELSRQKDLLLDKMAEFDTTNNSLRKLLGSQHAMESDLNQLNTQRELLLRRLAEAESTNSRLQSQLAASETDAMYSNHLKEGLKAKEVECDVLSRKIESLEGQLVQTNTEFEDLQLNVDDLQKKSIRDRETLKLVTKQQKEEAGHHEQMLSMMSSKLDATKSELSHSRLKTSKLQKERTKMEANLDVMRMKVAELEGSVSEAKEASKMTIESVNARIMEKTRELNSVQIENEKLKAVVRSTEDKLQSAETSSQSQVSTLRGEVVQLRASVSQYEDLMAEYKAQVSKLHLECDELRRQLQSSEQEVERVKQEGFIETEKVRAKLQHQISTLEPYPETLKRAEEKLQDSQDKVRECEDRISEQTKLIAEMTLKSEHYSDSLEELREKIRSLSAENAFLQTKIEATEKRLQEADRQNCDLVIISGKKEERIHQLESRLEEYNTDLSSTKRAMDTSRDESRRQLEQVKDRAASKERANLARIADLESQLSRANLSLSQMKRSKEEADKRYNTRISEMKERYEQANNAHKSLQNYVSLLKTSYVNMFSDLGTSPTKYSP